MRVVTDLRKAEDLEGLVALSIGQIIHIFLKMSVQDAVRQGLVEIDDPPTEYPDEIKRRLQGQNLLGMYAGFKGLEDKEYESIILNETFGTFRIMREAIDRIYTFIRDQEYIL